ncbi:MAG: transposase [Actinobacteria bacterium]|nr:transposase [Actinomycetota bacterium]
MDRAEAEAYRLLEQLRWGGAPTDCPHCDVTGRCYFLSARSPGRRVWKCGACRRQFSVLVGTVLQGTRASLWAWIGVVGDWQRVGQLPTASEIRERHGLSPAGSRQLRRRLERAAPLIAGPSVSRTPRPTAG